MSESSSDAESSESDTMERNGAVDDLHTEKLFITGVLDELKIAFNYNQEVKITFTRCCQLDTLLPNYILIFSFLDFSMTKVL